MNEGFPGRKRSPLNPEKLVYTLNNDNEKSGGTYTLSTQLEPGQWSIDHDAEIINVFNASDGGFKVVLSNGAELPLDRDDGLMIR